MTVFHQNKNAHNWTLECRAEGRRVSLVPTMGALHEGHMALVRHAKTLSDDVAVSIFVNPTQFGPNEDLRRYPRTLEQDLERLEAEGAAAVLIPSVEEMYPAGYSTFVRVEGLSGILEGAARPEHFQGVTTIVAKLFLAVPADVAVFGQKDFQQLVIIRRMVRDLGLPIEVAAHATVRDADGMALSSRNRYLSPEDRAAALALSRSLSAVREAAANVSDPAELERAAEGVLSANTHVSLDYAVVVDPDSLGPLTADWKRAAFLVAARVGGTRLIDNTLFDRSGAEVAA